MTDRTFTPGPTPDTVRAADGKVLGQKRQQIFLGSPLAGCVAGSHSLSPQQIFPPFPR
jgi:hypothetical protein